MKTSLRYSVLVLLFAFGIGTLTAQNCNAGKRIASKVWAKTGKWNNTIQFIPFKTQFNIKKHTWNLIVGNSSARWGPRHLPLSQVQTGTVHAGTKRTFVTDPLFYETMVIQINKTSGRGRTIVLVCEHSDSGASTPIAEYTFENTSMLSSKTFTLNNVRGKIISVAISGKTALRSLSYTIEATNNTD